MVSRVNGLNELKTFGWSLSGGVDVDANQYNGMWTLLCSVSSLGELEGLIKISMEGEYAPTPPPPHPLPDETCMYTHDTVWVHCKY